LEKVCHRRLLLSCSVILSRKELEFLVGRIKYFHLAGRNLALCLSVSLSLCLSLSHLRGIYNDINILFRFFSMLAGTSSQISSIRRSEEDDMAFFERRYQKRVNF
jgi:hypothetical protein